MGTYLVTGSAGFIAARVCELLLAAGNTVVGIDNLNDYYDVRLKDWRLARLLDRGVEPLGDSPSVSRFGENHGDLVNRSGRFVFRRAEIEDLPAMKALFEQYRFDAVFNLAARAGVRYSMENPHVYLTTNTHGTLNLLECMRHGGVTQMVLASTSSLYAGCPLPWSEDLPVNTPLSPYAASKKGAELIAYSYYKLYGINTTVVRYFTVFGPAGRPDMSIFRFIKWIDQEQPIELFGDGTQSRDFTYVDDIAAGTVVAARPLGCEIVNLGGGRNPVSLQSVIQFIEKRLGKQARFDSQPFHKADLKESWADITKADRLLHWKPTVLLEDGFNRTVDWYLENRAWLRQVRL